MPAKTQNLSDKIYNLLKTQILSGKIKGGEKIPEESLAKQFGVSRTPVREAVRRLGEYGLVTIKPRCYAEVATLTESEASDIAYVRIRLECFAVDLITKDSLNAHYKNLVRYASECQLALEAGNLALAFENDSFFHAELVAASENSALIYLYEHLGAKIHQLRLNQNIYGSHLRGYTAQHEKILDILEKGRKKDCKELLYNHITQSPYPEGLVL